MDLYSLSAKYAGLFHTHFTVRRDKNKRIKVSKSRRFSTSLCSTFTVQLFLLSRCNSRLANSRCSAGIHSQ